MERFTQMKILQKHAKYLEITSWICNNDLSAFLRCLWVKTCLSKVRQHRLHDKIGLFISFCVILKISIEHTIVFANSIFVY